MSLPITYHFIEPIDVLFTRGNKLFGEAGSYGISEMPPLPSVIAGAIRSRCLIDDGVDLNAFAAGQVEHPVLGSPKKPGPFAVTQFQLARRIQDDCIEPIYALPADLVATQSDNGIQLTRLTPIVMKAEIGSSSVLPQLPVLTQSTRQKAVTGYWLDQDGWNTYLSGTTPTKSQLIASNDLWQSENRVGIGLNPEKYCVDDGKLFTVQAISLHKNIGFVTGIKNLALRDNCMLRLGGDGRAAIINSATVNLPNINYDAISQSGQCRLVLTSPGLFEQGWLLPYIDQDYWLQIDNIRAHLVAAAVPSAQVISGWDLANNQPKSALKAAPIGSVYWFDQLEASPQALKRWVQAGISFNNMAYSSTRKAEGFNRFTLAAY